MTQKWGKLTFEWGTLFDSVESKCSFTRWWLVGERMDFGRWLMSWSSLSLLETRDGSEKGVEQGSHDDEGDSVGEVVDELQGLRGDSDCHTGREEEDCDQGRHGL